MADHSDSFERGGMERNAIRSFSTKQDGGNTFNKIKTGDEECGATMVPDTGDHAERLNNFCAGPSVFPVFQLTVIS